MKTSYFAQLNNISNPLSISGKAPEWYIGPEYKVLAPKWSFFNDYKKGKIDEDGYTQQYNDLVLSDLDAEQVYNSIVNQYGADVVLLCYEKPGDFCHRGLVARWFENKLGIIVPEWKNEKEVKAAKQNKVVDSLVDF